MMGWYGHGMGTGGWIAMVSMMVLFWGLVIFAGVMIFRGNDRSQGAGGASERSAIEILDERFARGEIDHQEYEARKTVLRVSLPAFPFRRI